MSFSSSPRSRPLLSSSSSSGSERKEEDVVVSDVIKDEGGFEDDPVVARLPRLDFRTSLLLDVFLLVLFPRHQPRVAASPSPSSSPPKAPFDNDAFCFARRNRLAGVLYAKGSRDNKVLFSFSSSSCKVNTVLMGLSNVVTEVVFPDDFDPPFVSSSSTMNCQNRSHNNTPLLPVCDDDSDDSDDAFTFDPMTTTTLKAYYIKDFF